MEKILLVEPNYKNKYPPIGLMKISTYFKSKGDFVQFHKGLLPKLIAEAFDKILITTLFTFDFDTCIKTIKYYIAIVGIKNVYVGGIAVTIMPEKFLEAIPNLNILTGQLVSSNALGYADDVNIDILSLDYDILWDITYDYPAADSYFIYTTRGCPRKCSFCAVKTLEPDFYECNNLIEQIQRVDEHFGIKKNLLIMDNNILYSKSFDETVNDLVALGFGRQNNKIKKCNTMRYYIKSLEARLLDGRDSISLLNRIRREFSQIKYSRVSKADIKILNQMKDFLDERSNEVLICWIKENKEFLLDFFDRYNYHLVSRFVDFNQGLDARFFSEEKAKKISALAIKPCRIAFDDLKTKDIYLSAMEYAVQYNITNFSNYLLYNYDEKPESLWERLNINIQFCKKHKDKIISLFSFPMKYTSIEHIDRSYVGKEWHKKYLRAINVILNATSGVVPKEEDFFYRAYGKSPKEFLEILSMPDEFIRFRDFFEESGLTGAWRRCFTTLIDEQRETLIEILDRMVEEPELLNNSYDKDIDIILKFYNIKKKNVENNELYYSKVISNITACYPASKAIVNVNESVKSFL